MYEWRSRSGGPQDFWLLPVLRHLFIYAFSNTASAKPRRVLFRGAAKNFFADSIAFFAPKSNLIMRPPPQKGDTHTPPLHSDRVSSSRVLAARHLSKGKIFFGWGGFISHPTGVLIMSTLYTPRTKGTVKSDFCARKENLLGWGDAVSHPSGVLKINTSPQGEAQTYKTQAVATPAP